MSHAILSDISRANPQLEYEVLQRIGGGTYGDVYKARRLGTSTLAAIKIIKFEPGDDLSVILQEIVVMKELNHANVVAYYGAYMRQCRLWICMEYCSGGSLQDIYHAIGPLPERHISFVIRETLKGLAYLHQMGKMHRDIKGANILLTEDGDVKLADFGVSAQITTTLSKRKSFIGSPYWMSPEIAAVERKGGYNQQCDIWSLGITSIELAELQPPLFDLHPMRALYLLSKSNYKPPQLKDRNKWSLDYQNFIKVSLTKNPKKRPTAAQLSDHPFVRQSNLSRALGKDLIELARNPQKASASSDRESLNEQETDDDNHGAPNRLQRIPSKKPPEENERSSPNLPSVLARFRNHLPGSNHNESVQLPSLEKSSDSGVHSNSSSETLDRTLRRPSDKQPSNRPKSTPVLPSMGAMSLEDSLDLDDDGFSSTLRIGQSERSHREHKTEWMEGETAHPEPPPRTKHLRKKKEERESNGGTLIANGLPKTPRVHMGACFSKVFNECPLHIHCTASWIHPVTRDQHILVASEEGLYTLNLNELHELAMDLLHNRRATWLHVNGDILMTVSGKTPHLYRHDLISLHGRQTNRFSLSMNKIPEKFMPRKFVASSKVAETRGCLRCCTGRNASNGSRYLAAAMPTNIILMQWYEPMSKYMMLRQIDWRLPSPFTTFYMLVKDADLPVVCTGVRPLMGELEGVQFEVVDFNSSVVTVTNSDAPSIPNAYLDIISINQIDSWTVLVASDNVVRVVDPEGKVSNRSTIPVTEFHFDFIISSIVCLTDGLLAFHRHGMQGRSYASDEVTQDIADDTKVYRALGSDRLTVLESKPVDHSASAGNLYIVTGHENNF